MPVHEFKLTLVSPAFTYGAYQRGRGDDIRPELRAQSIRGQLRYWLRAIAGAQGQSLDKVWERESAVFGSTGKGAVVSVRLFPPAQVSSAKEPMLPHRSSKREQSEQEAIREGQRFDLELVTRPGVMLPDDALHALSVWSLLGGIGKRSRRMFGAIRITSKDAHWYEAPANVAALQARIKETLQQVVGEPTKMEKVPAWPTLHPNHSWIVVGSESFDAYDEANRALFSLLRRDTYRKDERSFGYARGGRRASPLHAQIRRIDNRYYPVLTALRSQPDREIRWDAVGRFMKEAERQFSGKTVWGGW